MLTNLFAKTWKYVAVVVSTLGILLGAYLKGTSDQKSKEKSRELDTLRKGNEIDKKVSEMPSSELDRNLSRWMRD